MPPVLFELTMKLSTEFLRCLEMRGDMYGVAVHLVCLGLEVNFHLTLPNVIPVCVVGQCFLNSFKGVTPSCPFPHASTQLQGQRERKGEENRGLLVCHNHNQATVVPDIPL